MHDSKPIPSRVARLYRGAWVAWNRDQTKIIASGSSFDDAKQAAARAGEPSVVLGKIPASPSWLYRSRRLIHLVAVFIALGQSSLSPVGADPISSPPLASAAGLQQPLDAIDLNDDEASEIVTPPAEDGRG